MGTDRIRKDYNGARLMHGENWVTSHSSICVCVGERRFKINIPSERAEVMSLCVRIMGCIIVCRDN